MKKIFIIIITLSQFLIHATYSNENTSIKSGKKGECKIFIKQTDNDVFQEVKCTSELKYPEPIYGYDVKHCISYKTYRYARSFGKINGLYCSMNGYDQKSKWYYVK